MNEQRLFTRLNRLLASELGTSPTGLPMFEWGWSEDPKYYHPTLALDSGGQAIYDSRCLCGLNVPDDHHKPYCSLAIIREQRFHPTRLFDFQGYPDENNEPIRARWLLWRWKAPPPDSTWYAYEAAGLHPSHYRRGAYEPCSARTDDGLPFVLCIPRGANQTQIESLNSLCIGAFRQRIEQISRDPHAAARERRERQERYQRQTRRETHERILEGSLVLGHLPGEKDGVSFRQVPEKRSKGGIILPN